MSTWSSTKPVVSSFIRRPVSQTGQTQPPPGGDGSPVGGHGPLGGPAYVQPPLVTQTSWPSMGVTRGCRLTAARTSAIARPKSGKRSRS
jgi:hypothetical protein